MPMQQLGQASRSHIVTSLPCFKTAPKSASKMCFAIRSQHRWVLGVTTKTRLKSRRSPFNPHFIHDWIFRSLGTSTTNRARARALVLPCASCPKAMPTLGRRRWAKCRPEAWQRRFRNSAETTSLLPEKRPKPRARGALFWCWSLLSAVGLLFSLFVTCPEQGCGCDRPAVKP